MISIITMTKNRPHNVQRLVQSIKDTTVGSYEILFVVDKGDKTSVPFTEYTVIEQEGRTLNDMPNMAVPHATGNYFYLVGDDCVFRTKGWDVEFKKALEMYPDGICLVHANDLVYPDGRLATHPCLTRVWYDTLGYLTPPMFEVDYGDSWVTELANKLKRRVFLPHVITEHLHWYHGKAPMDETYSARDKFRESAAQQWLETQGLRDLDVAKLKKRITEHA